MPLNMTKIAYGLDSPTQLRDRLSQRAQEFGGEARILTRYLPKRHEEMKGGSLYWILDHALIARSEILGFEQRSEDGRWWIRLSPQLIGVESQRKRAHQGWRYLEEKDAPKDLPKGFDASDALPGKMLGELHRLGLM
ncbi:DUF1489 family protein [Altericroceibacterium endophyticum]|uniref:DUF1489 family protein n=1 Tax=Altericroceibacterium endophyticum TaxID=1808508 RepID=A0A6I4T9B3_9SPHN|nr:DUF1489 domain-containing protein [Altericroceibacterium endophyticum]MXO66872.1 DUF1489 family protein [Altericroceibacterium endophyticum]